MRQYKILISCYACSPYHGSEPGMGWNFVKGISRYHEVHVIVEQEKWEKDIKSYFKENPQEEENLNFYFIRKKRNRKLRKIWPPSYYYFYRQWQKHAFLLATELHKKEKFDLIHQLNMVGFREPGYLWKINLPFIWGPIGGMMNTPWSFFKEFDWYGKMFYGGRNLLNSLQKRALPRPKKAARRSNNVLIAATPDDQKALKKFYAKDSIVISEVGLVKTRRESINLRDNNKLIIIWSGQHTPGKALNILLKSLSKLPKNYNWELDVLGCGRMTKKWQDLAKELQISEKCRWQGWIEREKALEVMSKGHVFCITSLKDLTSTVTLEALSYALPIICLDHCGFAHVVNSSCGIKIPVNTPAEALEGFTAAIEKLYLDETYRLKLAKGAQERAKDFSWEKKIERLNTIYKRLV